MLTIHSDPIDWGEEFDVITTDDAAIFELIRTNGSPEMWYQVELKMHNHAMEMQKKHPEKIHGCKSALSLSQPIMTPLSARYDGELTDITINKYLACIVVFHIQFGDNDTNLEDCCAVGLVMDPATRRFVSLCPVDFYQGPPKSATIN